LDKLDNFYTILSAEDEELGKVKELEEFTKEHNTTREDMTELKELLIERSNNIKLNIKTKITGK